MSFENKTVLITGASRGIGKAIGLRLAQEGANIVIASKSVEENPKLGGTIFSSAAEMEAAGGKALAVQCDIRFEDQVQNMRIRRLLQIGYAGLAHKESTPYVDVVHKVESLGFSLFCVG